MSRRKSRSNSVSRGRDLWNVIDNLEKGHRGDPEAKENDKENETAPTPSFIANKTTGTESCILVVGPKESGKSTIIQQFLNPNKDEKTKPTVALDYTYGRRSNTSGDRKDITHIWELGGGTSLNELVSVVMTPQRLANLTVVIAVDLSQPGECIATLLSYIDLIARNVDICISDSNQSLEGVNLEQLLKAQKQKRRKKKAAASTTTPTDTNEDAPPQKDEPEQPDVLASELKVPVVIVGTKYDQLRDEDGIKRKLIAQILRYFALATGAGLVFVNKDEKSSLTQMRAMLNHYAFGTDAKRTVQTDSAKLIHVPAGKDNLESIGVPPGARKDDFQSSSANLLSKSLVGAWELALAEYFESSSTESKSDESKRDTKELRLAKEPAVDAVREKKLAELEQYRKDVQRKKRMQAKR